ncbi:MAG: MFS transporter [Chloroflexi bacterium]|nr:MFS transporter [Chloroflexota bacterium]
MLPTSTRLSAPSFVHRLPFFYGWLIVGIAMLAAGLGAGVNNVSMGVVLKPLSDELGWSRSLTTGAISAGTIVGGILAPLFGRLADRIGPRLLLPAGAAIVGTLALVLSRVVEPWQFYATYVPARALGQTLLFGVVSMTAATNWFHRMRPRAMGLVAMSIPLGSSALVLGYQVLIADFGWRAAFVALAALLWALVIPAALVLRRRPEDLGLAPDGGPAPAAAGPRAARRQRQHATEGEASWRLGEAVRTRTLWLAITATTLSVVCTGSIAFHLAAYYTDVGMDPLVAASALSVFAFSGAAAMGVWGFLAERVPPRGLYVTTMLLSAAMATLLLQVRTPLLGYVVAGLFGLTARGQDVLVQILLAHYFGRRSFGAISGFGEPFWRAGQGVGPLIAAASFDLTGSYQTVFQFFVAVYLVSVCLLLLLRRPVRRARAAESTPSPA